MRNELVQFLVNKGAAYLWSYDYKNPDFEIGDRILIEKILLYGSDVEWNKLKVIYSQKALFEAFDENIGLNYKFDSRSNEILKSFFGISDSKAYLIMLREGNDNKSINWCI